MIGFSLRGAKKEAEGDTMKPAIPLLPTDKALRKYMVKHHVNKTSYFRHSLSKRKELIDIMVSVMKEEKLAIDERGNLAIRAA
jgi:hypothetical protein